MGDLAVVTKGLAVGEPVVINGQYRLQAGVQGARAAAGAVSVAALVLLGIAVAGAR